MMPLRRRAVLASSQWLSIRGAHTKVPPGSQPSYDDASGSTPAAESKQEPAPLTGSAKLFADALAEESLDTKKGRDDLVHTQGPIWDGDERQEDAVLRMVMDKYKPLRTGEGIKHDAADKRIHNWMKNLEMDARHPVQPTEHPGIFTTAVGGDNPHRTKIPPHLHRPWHATYTGDHQILEAPKVKYGNMEQKPLRTKDFSNLLELRLPGNADGTRRAKNREARRSAHLQGRLDRARDGALDYRLGINDGDMTHVGSAEEETEAFSGNRQLRGSSVLGGQKGAASGLRAWAGLVEERITSAQSSGFFKNVGGRGAPLVRDQAETNPHLELGEVFMNRIIKRQGALPPWIEMQQNLNSSHNAFRNLLLDSYTRHIVRSILATHPLNMLPTYDRIPDRDEAFEAKERKFHEENVKQINSLLTKMNAQAPMPSRRGLVRLEAELDRVRGEPLRKNVWVELQRRAQDIRDLEARGHFKKSSPFLQRLEDGPLSRLGKRMSGTLGSTGGAGGGSHANASGGTMSANGGEAGGGMGLLILTGVGLGAMVYFRKPIKNDSEPVVDMIPVHDEHAEVFVATSPSEKHVGVLQVLRMWILEPFLTFLRFIHLALLFGPVIITAPMLFVGSPPRKKPGKPVADSEDNWGAVWWYGFLVKQMERAGPSFIKLGQWAASRADLFPAALCDKMSKLHSGNNPHSFRYTKKVLQKAFGLPFDEIFEEFEEKPIGCGAIAQVYRATLRTDLLTRSSKEAAQLAEEISSQEDGDRRIVTSVAIKVLHPRVEQTVRRDIAIMSIFANILNVLPDMEWLSLPEEVQVFGEMMNQQLDLRVEASNLERFRANFKNRPRTVTFPRPIPIGPSQVAATKNVLIEEYEDALPLKYFLRNGGGPYDEQIANLGLDAFLEMLLLDNWTHGDLHPGNIMVRIVKPETYHIIGPFIHRLKGDKPEDKKSILPTESISETKIVHALRKVAHDKETWLDDLEALSDAGYVPQLVFIDAGLVTSLDDTNRRNFLDLFQAVAEFDGYRAGKLMVERCKRPDLAIDEETFALKIQHLVLSVKSKTFSLAKIKISDILNDVLLAVRQHHVKLEGDFVNTVISILLLEGIGRQLDPNMDLFKSALPILRQVGRQMGTRDAISHASTGNLFAMMKLWVWAEARAAAGESSQIDRWIKFDWLMPNI